jgi:ribosome-associated protein
MALREKNEIETVEIARQIVDLIADKKGENIVLLDMRGQTIITDYFVICSGGSERQLKAIVEGVTTEIKKRHQISPHRVDGDAGTGWVLLDYGDVMVHAFSPEIRAYYSLEELWRDAVILLKMQ